MASGLPVISTDCPPGPWRIIRNDIDGILVPNEDVSALVAAMARLMSDAESETSSCPCARSNGTFQFRKVMGMWEALLEK